jgi:erythronate-4-phosphate dehydrogenase
VKLTVLADENIPAVEQYLGEFASVRRVNGRTLGSGQLDGVDVLFVRSVTRVDEALLGGSAVKFVGTATSGFDHVDREYLARNNIGFSHAPGSNANSVVEYVLAAIAAVNDKLEQLLAGGTIGIIGYGVIGKAVAARFSALGVQSRIYDPWLERSSIPDVADLDEILDCDIVTLHAELTNKQPWPSHHLLRLRELQRLRLDALLINASRGPVVDNTSLLAHIDTHPGRLTVLDVWEGEPRINGALLEQVTLGTAHIAGYSMDGKLLATRMLSEAVIRHFHLPTLAPMHGAQNTATLQVQDNLSPANLIRHLIQSRYDICLDDSLLRRAVAADHGTAAGGAGFDGLRKSYRERRELAGTVIAGLGMPDDIAIARALGCAIEESVTGSGA